VPISAWFWVIAVFALVASFVGVYGSMEPRNWGWRGYFLALLFLWSEVLILGWAQFGGVVK
jgi:hypothetical protein